MDLSTNMTPFVKCLMFTVVCLLIGGSCSEHSLDRRANVIKRSDRDTYYNIYTKINALEKDLNNLKTRLQKKKQAASTSPAVGPRRKQSRVARQESEKTNNSGLKEKR